MKRELILFGALIWSTTVAAETQYALQIGKAPPTVTEWSTTQILSTEDECAREGQRGEEAFHKYGYLDSTFIWRCIPWRQ